MKKLHPLLFLILACALPALGQTGHFDSRDTDNIFTTSGEPPSGAPADNDEVQQWDDESVTQWWSNAAAPNWRSSAPGMLLPVLDFNGTTDYLQLRTTSSALRSLDDLFNAGAKALLIAIRMDENCDGTDAANPYNNDVIIAENGGWWGVHCRLNGAQNELQLYNWDGAAKFVTLNVSINTNYVVGFRQDGTTLYGSLNCGSETTTASGSTTTMTGNPTIGAVSGTKFWSGRIGMIKTWDTATAGGNFATECTSMYNAFVASSGVIRGPLVGVLP